MKRTARGFLTLGVLIAGLLWPVAAQAAAPTNLVVSQSVPYHLSASWVLPAGTESHLLEASTSPVTSPDGGFASALVSADLLPAQTTYESPLIRPGTYYVHVASVAAGCAPTCANEFSDVKQLTIPPAPAPVLDSVGQSSRHLTASWSLDPPAENDFIEAATSPATYPEGDFLVENSVLFDFLDPGATSYNSTEQLPPGVYYVHVAAYDPQCPIGFCNDTFSGTLQVTIPADAQANAAPPPPAVQAQIDKATAFAALKVAAIQRADRLVVEAGMTENGRITVGGTINVPNASRVFKLRAVSVNAAAGKTRKIRVKLAKQTLKAVKRALKRHKKVRANLTVTAKDAAGNTKTAKRTVRLKL
jgi:hypothetical protein